MSRKQPNPPPPEGIKKPDPPPGPPKINPFRGIVAGMLLPKSLIKGFQAHELRKAQRNKIK